MDEPNKEALHAGLAHTLFDGLLSPELIDRIAAHPPLTDNDGVKPLLEEEIITFEILSAALQRVHIETIDLTEHVPTLETAEILGYACSTQYGVVPVKQEGNRLWLAMQNPLCTQTWMDLHDLTGMYIEPMLAEDADIRYCLNKVFSSQQIHSIASQFIVDENLKNNYTPDERLRAQLQNAPAVRLIDSLIESAVLYRASDIHIEPFKKSIRARYRIDGQLTTFQHVSAKLLPNIISRLKVMGNLNIAEKRLPQDGRFSLTCHGEPIDFRLSTLPTLYGEKAVIRLLYGQAHHLNKEELGFFPEDLAVIAQLFRSPYGAIFMTGPTGSGKSTTLHSFLQELNTDAVNIVTVEDPVENPIEGVNHINIEPHAGFNFANALRNMLRQDPDIIMIGEIRDAETARIAVQAAITGHLVLSTLHTNDAAGVMTRLVDMGVARYMVAAAINGIIAQRLVRRICPHCKVSVPITAAEAVFLQIPEGTAAYRGTGCSRCGNTGYRGRLAVYEYIIVDEPLRRQLAADGADIEALRRQTGKRLLDNGIRNVLCGNTSAAEIMRVLLRD